MRDDIPTLAVPAKLYDAALAFCNKRRKHAGLEHWNALPVGVPEEPDSCPCAQAVPRLSVDHNTWWIGDWGSALEIILPYGVRHFVTYFDENAGDIETLPIRGLHAR